MSGDLFGQDRLDLAIAKSMEIIDEAVAQHDPSHLFAMFSSGHDSLCASHLVSQHPRFTRAVTIDTTIGVREALIYARQTAIRYGWRLIEYRPPVSYREIVLKHGFPGPGAHSLMYRLLKERCIDRLVREHKTRWNDRIGLVTGVRTSESVRRMGHVEPIKRDGCQLWIAPIAHWTDDDKDAYMARHNLPRSPVVDAICMSGECLCGAFARKEELVELEHHFPETAAEIHELQRLAATSGKHAKWGERPKGGRRKPTMGGMLCDGCNQKNFAFMGEAA